MSEFTALILNPEIAASDGFNRVTLWVPKCVGNDELTVPIHVDYTNALDADVNIDLNPGDVQVWRGFTDCMSAPTKMPAGTEFKLRK